MKDGPAGKPSAEWLDTIAADMLAGLREIVPDLPEPVFMRAHRWWALMSFLSICGHLSFVSSSESWS